MYKYITIFFFFFITNTIICAEPEIEKPKNNNSQILCSCILKLELQAVLHLLEDGADPNFYMDKGHIEYNIPTALIQLASNPSEENIQKIILLLAYKADLNLQPPISFLLPYNGLRNTCICQEPTPLAVAIAYDNPSAVSLFLSYEPKKRCFNEAFLSTNPLIKKTIFTAATVTQEDLDEGLKSALLTQNIEDIQTLLAKGAHPHQQLKKTVDRTIEYCLHPDRYVSYDSLSNNPGAMNWRGYSFPQSAIPIPDVQPVQELCAHGAYDEGILIQLKGLQKRTSELVRLLEANTPKQ